MKTTKLSVNVDHVATLRQARGVRYPDPTEAAMVAEGSGSAGITVHLRGDRRHIQDSDVERLRVAVVGKLNLEMAATSEMLAIALRLRPDQVTLVPERPEEVTTEGGLELSTARKRVAQFSRSLAAAGIGVSLFLDPVEEQLRLAASMAPTVRAIELNTDRYTRASGREQTAELEQLARSASLAAELGLTVYGGHGLTTGNVGPVSRLPEIEELNIGHSIVSRAVLVGMAQAVEEILTAMRTGG